IAVPYLGLRERLAIDKLMPDADARTVVRRLKLRLSDNYWDSVLAISNYMEFYQYVPQFLKVSV
ncbi:MAG: O-methyltransferase, partial [Bryobacteraceae bacterium]